MRIGYWTTCCLEPRIEAVSKEVIGLARHFGGKFVFSVNPHYFLRLSRRCCYIGFHPSFDPIIRPLIRILERQTDMGHIYGEYSPWVFYKTLMKRPMVLTVSSEKGELVPEFLERCDAVVVQTEKAQRRLLKLGISPSKLHLIYPGVDLKRFRPATNPPDLQRPKVLFASAPRSFKELNKRGVFLLLDTAALVPNVEFRLLFRIWRSGDTAFARVKREMEKRGLHNVVLTQSAEEDMSAIYPKFNFTLIPYTYSEGGKECPYSALEGLACGLPTIVTEAAPFASFVREHRCGIVGPATPEGIAQSIREGLDRYNELRERSRQIAEMLLPIERTFASYSEIYSRIL